MLALPAIAAAKDRNHDRIPDRWEKRHNLSLQVNQAGRDQDRDHLRNRAEFMAGDNPRSSDSDGDGIPDGEENAGTIQSFDPSTGKLTIALFGGETLSGLVGEETEIECGGDHPGMASASEDGEEHGSPAAKKAKASRVTIVATTAKKARTTMAKKESQGTTTGRAAKAKRRAARRPT